MKNYHAEKDFFCERKIANRIRNKMAGGGFVEAKSGAGLGKMPSDVYRVVVYHPDLRKTIDKIWPNSIEWKIKKR